MQSEGNINVTQNFVGARFAILKNMVSNLTQLKDSMLYASVDLSTSYQKKCSPKNINC